MSTINKATLETLLDMRSEINQRAARTASLPGAGNKPQLAAWLARNSIDHIRAGQLLKQTEFDIDPDSIGSEIGQHGAAIPQSAPTASEPGAWDAAIATFTARHRASEGGVSPNLSSDTPPDSEASAGVWASAIKKATEQHNQA